MKPPRLALIISANTEWRALQQIVPQAAYQTSPMGQWFVSDLGGRLDEPTLFFHGGWGKIAAAAATQYLLDRWQPHWLLNMGTCGGFAGQVAVGEVLLAQQTIVYDIVTVLGDQATHTAHYTTALNLSWLAEPLPYPVRRTTLVSADRDILAEEMPQLQAEYGAIAGDWESGAIAWVAQRNQTPCLILRAVSDLISPEGGEAYGNFALYEQRTQEIMARFIDHLPGWVAHLTASAA